MDIYIYIDIRIWAQGDLDIGICGYMDIWMGIHGYKDIWIVNTWISCGWVVGWITTFNTCLLIGLVGWT